MLKEILLFIFCCCTFLLSLGQPEIDYPVCSLDDGPVSPGVIAGQSLPLDKSDVLWEYLQNIKTELRIKHTQFILKKITQRATSCAMILKNGDVMERAIAINEDHYINKVSLRLKKAMFIWILGHEITHHNNDDHYYLNEKNQLKNIVKEVLCDENAGYLLGKLTDATLKDVSTVLNSILRNNDTSIYYPPLKYRIYAAQAGWLRAKAEHRIGDKPFEVLGSKITKYTSTASGIRLQAVNSSDTSNIERRDFGGSFYFGAEPQSFWMEGYGISLQMNNSSEKFEEIKFGNSREGRIAFGKQITPVSVYYGSFDNGSMRSKGILVWYNSNWEEAERYEGDFMNGQRDGFGVYIFEDRSKYVGEWRDSQRDGYGVLFKGESVINDGWWKSNSFIGKNNPNLYNGERDKNKGFFRKLFSNKQ